jgi:hypothetical protein
VEARQLLAKMDRQQGGDRRSSSRAGNLKFWAYLKEIGRQPNRLPCIQVVSRLL